jgi:hypothetical protein
MTRPSAFLPVGPACLAAAGPILFVVWAFPCRYVGVARPGKRFDAAIDRKCITGSWRVEAGTTSEI